MNEPTLGGMGTDSDADRVRGITEYLTTLHRIGRTEILRVNVQVNPDSEGEQAVFLDLELSDPREDTWPHDEILELRHRILDWFGNAELLLPVYVNLQPHTDPPQDEEMLVANG